MSSSEERKNDGVIVGCDDTLEWMLPWWWDHYSATNVHPVTFIDFGMTEEAKAWCHKQGQLIRLEMADIFVTEKEEIDASHIQAWENLYGKQFWVHRTGWFKKPMACLLSPYDRTIWIDLDCEVRGSLNNLFAMADHPSGIAMAQDIHAGFNSGVIIFKKGLPLIQAWAQEALHANHLFAGDQDIVSKIIAEKKLEIGELSPLYNWSRIKGDSKDAVIYHWHGRHGKAVIAMLNWLKI